MLFRDSYRPVMGIERDGIRQLPVEALIDCQLIEEQIQQEGYEGTIRFYSVGSSTDSEWIARQYLELAEKRPDFVERMYIHCEEGVFSYKQWPQTLGNCQCLELDDTRRIDKQIYNSLIRFRLSWLQSQCVLRIRLELHNPPAILATAEQPTPGDTCWLDFPPAFFLPPEREDCPYLTDSNIFNHRCACNANHRLSRFLIDNADKLRSTRPASSGTSCTVWRRIMQTT